MPENGNSLSDLLTCFLVSAGWIQLEPHLAAREQAQATAHALFHPSVPICRAMTMRPITRPEVRVHKTIQPRQLVFEPLESRLALTTNASLMAYDLDNLLDEPDSNSPTSVLWPRPRPMLQDVHFVLMASIVAISRS